MFFDSRKRIEKIEDDIKEIKLELMAKKCKHNFSVDSACQYFVKLPNGKYQRICDKCKSILQIYETENEYILEKMLLLKKYCKFLSEILNNKQK